MVLSGERRVSGSLCGFCMCHPIPCRICMCPDAWSCRMLLTDAVGNPTGVLRRAGVLQRGWGALVGHMVHQFTSGFFGRHGTGSGACLRGVGHIQKGQVMCDKVGAAQGTSGVVVPHREGPGCVQCIVCTCDALRVHKYMIAGLACVQVGVLVHILSSWAVCHHAGSLEMLW